MLVQHIRFDQACDSGFTCSPSQPSRACTSTHIRTRSTTARTPALASSTRLSCLYPASKSALPVERTRSPDAGRVSPRPHTPALRTRRRSSNASRTTTCSATPCFVAPDARRAPMQEGGATIMPSRASRGVDRTLTRSRSTVGLSFASGARAGETVPLCNLHAQQQRGRSRRRNSGTCSGCSLFGIR